MRRQSTDSCEFVARHPGDTPRLPAGFCLNEPQLVRYQLDAALWDHAREVRNGRRIAFQCKGLLVGFACHANEVRRQVLRRCKMLDQPPGEGRAGPNSASAIEWPPSSTRGGRALTAPPPPTDPSSRDELAISVISGGLERDGGHGQGLDVACVTGCRSSRGRDLGGAYGALTAPTPPTDPSSRDELAI